MTEIKILELMDAIQQTQKTADDMWRVLREVLEEQRNAQQSVQADVCPSCGVDDWAYGDDAHTFEVCAMCGTRR